MKILLQLSLLFILTITGNSISALLPFPFPGTLIAMFLMLLLLGTGIVKENQITETADFFTRYMAMFFAPAGVEIIENLELMKTAWLPVVIIALVSLFTTFLAAAKAVELTEFIISGKKESAS